MAAADEDALDRADVAVFAAPCQRDMLDRWLAIVRRIEIEPTNPGAPGRDPGMRGICPNEARFSFGGRVSKYPLT